MLNKILIGFLSIMLLIPVTGAFASGDTPDYSSLRSDSLAEGYTHWYLADDGLYKWFFAIKPQSTVTDMKVRFDSSNKYLSVTDAGVMIDFTFKKVRYDNGAWVGTTVMENMRTTILSNVTFLEGNYDLFPQSGDTPFFEPPAPYQIAKGVGLEGLGPSLVKTIVDGGILSLGLMTLAILLGVSLIPRLIRFFHR